MKAVSEQSIDVPIEQTSEPSKSGERRVLGGLLVRHYRWTLSWKAKLPLFVVSAGLAVAAWLNIYPFLAQTQRVDADILVVEGWVQFYVIREGVKEYNSHPYRKVFTTGGPVAGNGGYVNDFQTSASVGAESLVRAGLPADVVQMAPSRVIGRDRTYNSAVALRDWLREHHEQARSFNIVTQGAHARRTRIMFQRAFGPEVNVGVIPVLSPDFDAKHWWYYSEGTEEAVSETMAYVYAAIFFPLIELWHGEAASRH